MSQIDNNKVFQVAREAQKELSNRELALLAELLLCRLSIHTNSEKRKKGARRYIDSVYGKTVQYPNQIIEMEKHL